MDGPADSTSDGTSGRPVGAADELAARARFYGTRPRSRLAAGVLVTDRTGRVLLVEPTYKPTWEIPGGGVEAGEDAPTACARECREELGIDLPVGRLLVLDHLLDPLPRGAAINFVYDGGVLDAAAPLVLPPAELRSHRFVDPADLDGLVIPRLARRVRCALDARRDASVVELSGGRPR